MAVENYQSKIRDILKNPHQSFQLNISHPIFSNEYTQQFLKDHPQIREEHLFRSMTKLNSVVEEIQACKNCQDYEDCPNLLKGHRAYLNCVGTTIDVTYTPCEKHHQNIKQKRLEARFQSHYISKAVRQASFQSFEQNENNSEAFRAVHTFSHEYEIGKPMKGIFLYGSFGVGKSHLMAALANRLAQRNITVLMVYTPDFFREIRESFGSENEKPTQRIESVKKVPVLIMDDIGAETITPWIRDEIIGPIVQYRITHDLPILYTSNYNYDLLEDHFRFTTKGGSEKLKAKRIMDRVRNSTNEIYIHDRNHREQG